jgi:ABC-type spermidine/putrescine transport system permease subunit II
MAMYDILSTTALSFLIAFNEFLIAPFLARLGWTSCRCASCQSVSYELTPAVAVIRVFLMG